ncbi:MAG: ABC transporter ATP-binding protein, partial [Bacteroidaceae bacterium]|nr:ABC transporter ATP-binding protein [Bacteroidaceae bacterium]
MIRRLLHWLWLASEGIRGKLVLNALCGFCYIAASLAFVYFSKGTIDMVTRGEAPSRGIIYLYGLILLLLFLSEMGLNLLMSWLENQTEVTQKNHLRHRLYSHLMHVEWEEWERFHSGDVLNRLEEDVRVIAEAVCKSVPQLFITGVQILAA